MSVFEGVDGSTSTTVSDRPSTVADVAEGEGRRPLRELVDDRLLDELLARSRDEAGGLRLTGEGSMLGELVRAVLERALEAELTAHLGYTRHTQATGAGNARNGRIAKTVQTGVGPVRLSVPRDRAGSFEPVLVPKRAGRVAGGLDDMVISLYAHGMSVRDIVHHLEQVYGTQMSAETVSRITEQVMEEVKSWQRRPLDPVYPVVFLDALMVKVRDNHVVTNKPAYLAVGIDADGDKHVLGIWVAKTGDGDGRAAGEGAGFWRSVVGDLKNRGVNDILIACCDGLTGFEDAIHSAFPATTVQTCVVHLIRNSLRPVPRKDRAAVAAELKKVYTAPDADAARDALAELSAGPLGQRYPQTVRVWENAWDQMIPFMAFTPSVRKLLYTTNSIESLNYQLRKVTKARGHFPTDDAVVKLLWLAIINIEDKRTRERATRKTQDGRRSGYPGRLVEGIRTYGWPEALSELADAYPDRIR
jgi:putative transposase